MLRDLKPALLNDGERIELASAGSSNVEDKDGDAKSSGTVYLKFDEEDFRCPLSFELFANPLIDPEGNTYSSAEIRKILEEKPRSPFTRTPLTAGQLRKNNLVDHLVRNAILKKQAIDKRTNHITLFIEKSLLTHNYEKPIVDLRGDTVEALKPEDSSYPNRTIKTILNKAPTQDTHKLNHNEAIDSITQELQVIAKFRKTIQSELRPSRNYSKYVPGLTMTLKGGAVIAGFIAFAYLLAQSDNHKKALHKTMDDTTQIFSRTLSMRCSGPTGDGRMYIGMQKDYLEKQDISCRTFVKSNDENKCDGQIPITIIPRHFGRGGLVELTCGHDGWRGDFALNDFTDCQKLCTQLNDNRDHLIGYGVSLAVLFFFLKFSLSLIIAGVRDLSAKYQEPQPDHTEIPLTEVSEEAQFAAHQFSIFSRSKYNNSNSVRSVLNAMIERQTTLETMNQDSHEQEIQIRLD